MKKKNNYFALLALVLMSALGLAACSKGNDPEPMLGNSALTMKVDGEPWAATMTSLFTEADADGYEGEYHFVAISASRVVGKDSQTGDDLSETLVMYVAIPSSTFRSPIGTYPVSLDPNPGTVSHASAVFSTSTDLREANAYIGRDRTNPTQSVGNLEITGFKIGQQNVLGQPTGVEGYTQLSGTFRMDLMPVAETGATLKVTEGKFNLEAGIVIIQ